MILVFDTETTGKANFRLPATDPSQPRIVQLAAALLDDDLTERAAFCYVIKPNGWTIPNEASDIHGITTEIAERTGIDIENALSQLCWFSMKAEMRIAHNVDFDDLMVAAEFGRFGDVWEAIESQSPRFCTMRAMTPKCKLPGNYGDFKWPKLTEAYRHCFGREMEGAHDALADVRGCADVYRWLKKSEVVA